MVHKCSSSRVYREITDNTTRCVDCGGRVAAREVRTMRAKCMFCGGPRESGKASAEHGCEGAQKFRRSEATRRVRQSALQARTIPAPPDAKVYTAALTAGRTADEAMVLARNAGAERARSDASRNAEARDYRAKLRVNSAGSDGPPQPPDMGKYLRAKSAGKTADEAMAAARGE